MTARQHRSPSPEVSISDGTRHLGTVLAKSGSFECFGEDGAYMFRCTTAAEARSAVIRADREGRAA